jgi:hypothetical protein
MSIACGTDHQPHGPRECVLRGQFLDLVFLAQRFADVQQVARELRIVALGAIPQILQRAELLLAHLELEHFAQRLRRVRVVRHGAVMFGRVLERRVGVVRREDLALALLEHGDERLEARPQPPDLRGIQPHRVGQLLLGEVP